MDFLQSMLSQGPERDQADDFVRRYDQGEPWDGIDDDEAMSRYQQVATRLPRNEYEESAASAFSRLQPDQRRELGQHLQQGAQQRGFDLGSLLGGEAGAYEDPRRLAQASAALEEQQPGILGQLLGGQPGSSQGGMLSHPIAKAALGGIAAVAMKKFMGGSS